ncbi:hypothetical protein LZ31DRAFT_315226 [Colletotrichum somersetense]|nr:hypothetical protein LZ31DRAFT_315226 [Colletotrichum somersetense]
MIRIFILTLLGLFGGHTGPRMNYSVTKVRSTTAVHGRDNTGQTKYQKWSRRSPSPLFEWRSEGSQYPVSVGDRLVSSYASAMTLLGDERRAARRGSGY